MAETLKKTRWNSCNVLRVAAEGRHLWQFDARFVLNREQTSFPGESLPVNLVSKDWRSLFQPKLNVACLPPEHVFLRAAQFPRSAFPELLSMVELQLEKLSPIPVTQIVWSIHALPPGEGNMQTVIVMIVARTAVEEFLGKLEGDGYLADRLELPLLDQLQATPVREDGAWVYPEAQGIKNSALVAWWYGSTLQSLDFITLSAGDRVAQLKEQLMQMAWAGELDGWLKAPPRWHLVAEKGVADDWAGVLKEALDQPVDLLTPLAPQQLAALTAQRAAQADPKANLLPAEFGTRYHQQFVDRLWMRGLLAIAALYLVGVLIYGVALEYSSYQTGKVEAQVASLSSSYTNAMLLRAQCKVLKDREDLKFAALECWKILAEKMPEDLTLDSWSFGEGQRLTLSGTANHAQDFVNFQAAMFKATAKEPNGDEKPVFDPTEPPEGQSHVIPPGTTVGWSFRLALLRTQLQ